ncbi:YkvA family protein [Bdellovibrio sp. HCB185ZH]|uniref:YkvA family protein n=1 Tax=Bdellovibrio sp. HCB185ZH TaxID=3394235 RepID=UPI0039A74072
MKISQISKISKDTGLSPEKLAVYFQVSNMTLRRWLKKGGTARVPSQYDTNIYQGILAMVKDGAIDKDHECVKEAYEFTQVLFANNSFMMMDLQAAQFENTGNDEDGLMDLCLRLGQRDDSLSYVQRNEQTLQDLEKKSPSIREKVTALWQVLKDGELQKTSKYVAVGALFYLVFPFDFIPDSVPGVGLLDDYAILSIAMDHYLRIKNLKG